MDNLQIAVQQEAILNMMETIPLSRKAVRLLEQVPKALIMEDLVKQLKADKEYRESWKANIAMAYIDCERWYKERTGKKTLNREDKHIIANEAAEYFLTLLCADTSSPENESEKEN